MFMLEAVVRSVVLVILTAPAVSGHKFRNFTIEAYRTFINGPYRFEVFGGCWR